MTFQHQLFSTMSSLNISLPRVMRMGVLTLTAAICLHSGGHIAYAQDNPFAGRLDPSGPANETSRAIGEPGSALPQEPSKRALLGRADPAPGVNNQALEANTINQTAPSLSAEQQAKIEAEAAQKRKEEIREKAFEAALNGLIPLEPNEIREVLKKYDRTREAIETPYYPYPKPTVSVLPVSLDPGAPPPELQLATGHVTTVSILDVTGEPWPIEDISWAGDFQFAEAAGGHIIRITPLAEFAHGNVSMRMVGLKTPITITLKTQRNVVQYRVDIRLPGNGPNAQVPLIDRGPGLQAGNGLVSAILDGSPPPNIEKLDVTGVDGRTTAYRANGFVYLRTPLTLLSPGWVSSARSGDGTSVFVLNDTPLVLLSDQGRMQRARLKVDTNDELL